MSFVMHWYVLWALLSQLQVPVCSAGLPWSLVVATSTATTITTTTTTTIIASAFRPFGLIGLDCEQQVYAFIHSKNL